MSTHIYTYCVKVCEYVKMSGNNSKRRVNECVYIKCILDRN